MTAAAQGEQVSVRQPGFWLGVGRDGQLGTRKLRLGVSRGGRLETRKLRQGVGKNDQLRIRQGTRLGVGKDG